MNQKMVLINDFKKTFGIETYRSTLEHAGVHSREKVPRPKAERLTFGLLEMLDFHCYEYGDIPKGLNKETIESFLCKHKEVVLKMQIPPPSYMGLFIGTFNFLVKEE